MASTVASLLASGKGILAADESFPTIGKRFTALGIASTEESRRAYRELLFTTPGLGGFISGAILFDETLHQSITSGFFMPETLVHQGIIPGIKVDGGAKALPGFSGEKITHGFDGLSDRLAAYRERGARFTKWRAVIAIGDGVPTRTCIEANAQALALFAASSQEAGLVPVVEPEVLMSGDHTLARCEEITSGTLQAVFDALFQHHVAMEAMLLKTGMVLPGKDCAQQATTHEIAEATLRCLRRHVPAVVPGVVFLSGGQDGVEATERLNAICQPHCGAPWTVSFSFGRALQDQAMKTWKGDPANIAASQAALHHRARCNGLAVQGKYTETVEHEGPPPHSAK